MLKSQRREMQNFFSPQHQSSNNSTVDLTEESYLKPKPESNSTTYSTLYLIMAYLQVK